MNFAAQFHLAVATKLFALSDFASRQAFSSLRRYQRADHDRKIKAIFDACGERVRVVDLPLDRRI